MKTLNYIAAFILIIALPVVAGAKEKAIDDQVEAVEATYQGAADISTDFTQSTYIDLLEKTVTKRGRMYFKKGGKFRIEYDGTGEKRYISSGKFIWVFVPGDPSSMLTYQVNNDTVPREALTFLSEFRNLKKDFRISPSKVYTDLAPGVFAFYLKPKSRKSHFKALDTKFNLNNLLEDLKVYNKSGNVSTYHFSNIKTSTGLPDSLFTPPSRP